VLPAVVRRWSLGGVGSVGIWAEVFFGSIRYARYCIDSREVLDTLSRYKACSLPRFSIRFSIHTYIHYTQPGLRVLYVLRALLAVPSATAVAEHTVVYPTSSYYISWIEHRTDLEGPSIRYSLRVSYRGRGLDTLRSVPKKREAYRRYTPSAQIPIKNS
jgi:hypothetical protein